MGDSPATPRPAGGTASLRIPALEFTKLPSTAGRGARSCGAARSSPLPTGLGATRCRGGVKVWTIVSGYAGLKIPPSPRTQTELSLASGRARRRLRRSLSQFASGDAGWRAPAMRAAPVSRGRPSPGSYRSHFQLTSEDCSARALALPRRRHMAARRRKRPLFRQRFTSSCALAACLHLAAAVRQQDSQQLQLQQLHGGSRPRPATGWGHFRDPSYAAKPASRRDSVVEFKADLAMHKMREVLSRDVIRHVFDLIGFRFQIASCSMRQEIVTIWGARGPRRVLRGHTAEVAGVQFFPLGDRALTWSRDTTARIWDTASGKSVHVFEHRRQVKCAQIFPKGDRVVTCSEEGVCFIRDAESGELLSKLFNPRVRGVEVFPRGDRVLTWGRHSWASVWDTASGDIVCRLPGRVSAITMARVFPGGDKVITYNKLARAVIWDTASCRALHELGQPLGASLGGLSLDGGTEGVGEAGPKCEGGPQTLWPRLRSHRARDWTWESRCPTGAS